MTWDTIQQLVRMIMQISAGFLVQRGIITEEMATTVVGAMVSLTGVAWWVLWDRSRPADTTT